MVEYEKGDPRIPFDRLDSGGMMESSHTFSPSFDVLTTFVESYVWQRLLNYSQAVCQPFNFATSGVNLCRAIQGKLK